MKHVLSAFVLFVAGCAGARTQGPTTAQRDASAGPLASAETPTLEHWIVDQVELPESTVRAGRVRGILHAPYEQLVATALDFERYHEFFPYLTESRVVQRRRGETDVYLRLELRNNLGTLWSNTRFVVERTPGRLQVHGTLMDGNLRTFIVRFDVEETAHSEESLVTLTLLGVPPFPLPDFLLSSQQARWAERVLHAFGAQVARRGATLNDAGVEGG